MPVHKKVKSHMCHELLPTETVTTLNNLCENTDYEIIVTAITEEFFDQLPTGHEWKDTRTIPNNLNELPENEWLPKAKLSVSQ